MIIRYTFFFLINTFFKLRLTVTQHFHESIELQILLRCSLIHKNIIKIHFVFSIFMSMAWPRSIYPVSM